LFSSAIIYFLVNGLQAVKRIFGLSILTSVVGGLLSILTPEIFLATIKAVNGNLNLGNLGRAFGFEIQANRLACNTSMMFIAWFALQKWNNNSIKLSLIALIFFAFILLTGSRTGIVISFVIIMLSMIFTLRDKTNLKKRFRNYLILGILTLVVLFSLANYIAIKNPDQAIAHRMNWFVGLLSFDHESRNVIQESANTNTPTRLELQLGYLKMIFKQPWGYGLNGDQFYLKSGKLTMTAHSEFLTTAFQFSILYPFALLLVMLNFMRTKKRKEIEHRFGMNFLLQFIIVFVLIFGYAQGTLSSRAFLITFAFIYTIFYFPEYFTNDNYKKENPHTI
jgi:O-antigen ligase